MAGIGWRTCHFEGSPSQIPHTGCEAWGLLFPAALGGRGAGAGGFRLRLWFFMVLTGQPTIKRGFGFCRRLCPQTGPRVPAKEKDYSPYYQTCHQRLAGKTGSRQRWAPHERLVSNTRPPAPPELSRTLLHLSYLGRQTRGAVRASVAAVIPKPRVERCRRRGRQGCQGAAAALVSSGTTVPFSPTENDFPGVKQATKPICFQQLKHVCTLESTNRHIYPAFMATPQNF